MWTDKQTSFNYSMFVVWKTLSINEKKSRTIVDIREFNRLLKFDAYLISLQDDIITLIRDCAYIIVVDATSFFYQWRVHSNDKHKLIVVTHREQETFYVFVMSCKNSSIYVQRQIDRIFRSLRHCVRVYVDDVVIFFKTLEKHVSHLRAIFDLFVKLNIFIKSNKTFFDYSNVQLLDQHVDFFDLSIVENKLKIINMLQFSRTLRELEIYLDMTNWLRQYISYYAQIEKSLKNRKINLLKLTSKFDNSRRVYSTRIVVKTSFSIELIAFDILQELLSRSSYFVHHDSSRFIFVNFDASKKRDIDVMIFHVKNDIVSIDDYFNRSSIQFILFLNRLLTVVEIKYWFTKLKIVEFVWILKKIRHMIESSIKIILYINHDVASMKTVIYTNHAITLNIARQSTLTTSFIDKLNLRLVRASEFFNRFDLDIRHKFDKKHVVFDALSRLSNVNFEAHLKSENELDVLHIYQVIISLIHLNDEFRNKILDDYDNDLTWKRIKNQILINEKLDENVVSIFFQREITSTTFKKLIKINFSQTKSSTMNHFIALIKINSSQTVSSSSSSSSEFTSSSSTTLKINVSDSDFTNQHFSIRFLIYHVDKLIEHRRLCISKSCIKNILDVDHINSNHSKFVRCFEKLSINWYIRDLSKHLRIYLYHCSKCFVYQTRRHQFYDSLQFIEKSSVLFHIIIIDFIFALSIVIEIEYDFSMSMICKFSKRVTFVIEKSTWSTFQWNIILIDKLNVADWNTFNVILFDKNRKIFSELWITIFKYLDVKLLYSIVYHSQIDDQSEIINQIVEIALRYLIVTLNNFDKWSFTLSRLQIELNNVSSITIDKSINDIIYDFTSDQSLNFINLNASIINQHIVRTKAIDVIFFVIMSQKRHNDRRHQSTFLVVDEWALFRLHKRYNILTIVDIIKKYDLQYVDSFKMLERIDRLVYKLEISDHWRVHSIFTIIQLKSCSTFDSDFYRRLKSNQIDFVFVKNDIETYKFFELDKLLNKRIINKDKDVTTQYLARWKDYDSQFDKWINIKNLNNVKNLINQYEITIEITISNKRQWRDNSTQTSISDSFNKRRFDKSRKIQQ